MPLNKETKPNQTKKDEVIKLNNFFQITTEFYLRSWDIKLVIFRRNIDD